MAKRSAPAPSGRIIGDELYKTCVTYFSGARAKRTVEAVSLHHRIQTSKGILKASNYIVSELKAAGLDEVKIHSFPSDGKRKYYQWGSPAEWVSRRGVLKMLEPEEKIIAAFPDIMCALCPGSQKAKNVRGELVYLPSAARDSDFKGVNVKNKLVMSSSSARAMQKEAVVKRGALGCVFFPQILDDPDLVKYAGFYPQGKDLKTFTFGFSVSRRTAEYLINLLKSGRKIILEANVDAEVKSGSMPVVSATLRGRDKKGDMVGIISHICHPSPGANDNASGTAVNLEIARTLVDLIKSKKIKRPKRSISFLWVPEFHGTFAFLEKYKSYAKKLVGLINLDMVGEDQHKCNSTLKLASEPHSVPGVVSDIMNDAFLHMLDEPVHDSDGTRNELRYRQAGFKVGSDHQVFAERTFSVPSIHLVCWPDTFYHSSHDLPEYSDATMLKRVGAASMATALMLADTTPERAIRIACHAASNRRGRLAAEAASRKSALPGLMESGSGKTVREYIAKMKQELESLKESCAGALTTAGRLTVDKKALKYIESESGELTDFAEREIASFLSLAESLASSRGIRNIKPPRPDDIGKEMRSLVPAILFEGNISWDHMQENLGKKEYEFYSQNLFGPAEFYAKAFEAQNFADGIKSVHEIFICVSAEFPGTKREHILKFFKDLKKTGLAKLDRKKS
ncbi:MAG: DUF4910 domain-containing protein [Planctomycetota bacterium]|jgi:aminopeptidase-like protein